MADKAAENPFTPERFAQFREVVDGRWSCKRFSTDPIPEEIIGEVIAVTQRAPTSFNSQPYRIILVRNKAQREALAECMAGKNDVAVMSAPVTAVFCADTEIVRENARLTSLLLKTGGIPPGYVKAVPG